MGELWDIIQRFMDDDDRTESWVARSIGLSTSGLHKWKIGLSQVPNVVYLNRLSDVTRVSFDVIVTAAAHDARRAMELRDREEGTRGA